MYNYFIFVLANLLNKMVWDLSYSRLEDWIGNDTKWIVQDQSDFRIQQNTGIFNTFKCGKDYIFKITVIRQKCTFEIYTIKLNLF